MSNINVVQSYFARVVRFSTGGQRYTYRVLQTIQIELILLCVWADGPFWAVLKLL